MQLNLLFKLFIPNTWSLHIKIILPFDRSIIKKYFSLDNRNTIPTQFFYIEFIFSHIFK